MSLFANFFFRACFLFLFFRRPLESAAHSGRYKTDKPVAKNAIKQKKRASLEKQRKTKTEAEGRGATAAPTKPKKKKRVRLRLVTLHSAWLVASALLMRAGLDILRFSFSEKLPDNSDAQLQLKSSLVGADFS
jgi:hypothetical protein